MIDPVNLGLVLGGAVLLFAGAALSVYGVVLLGTVLGGTGGYLLGPTVAAVASVEVLVATTATAVAGIVVGGVLSYVLLSFAVAAMSFVVGTFVGATTLAPLFVDGQWYVELTAAVVIGIVAAILGAFVTKWMLAAITAFVGATFASRSITVADMQAAQEAVNPDPLLFEVAAPAFLALFVLGLLSQFGLFKFGYVTKIAALLPGTKLLPGRRGGRDESKPT